MNIDKLVDSIKYSDSKWVDGFNQKIHTNDTFVMYNNSVSGMSVYYVYSFLDNTRIKVIDLTNKKIRTLTHKDRYNNLIALIPTDYVMNLLNISDIEQFILDIKNKQKSKGVRKEIIVIEYNTNSQNGECIFAIQLYPYLEKNSKSIKETIPALIQHYSNIEKTNVDYYIFGAYGLIPLADLQNRVDEVKSYSARTISEIVRFQSTPIKFVKTTIISSYMKHNGDWISHKYMWMWRYTSKIKDAIIEYFLK